MSHDRTRTVNSTCGCVVSADVNQRRQVDESRTVLDRTLHLKKEMKTSASVPVWPRLVGTLGVLLLTNTNTLTCCSHTRGVWKEKKCVQVSELESMRTGSGGVELMVEGLTKHRADTQNTEQGLMSRRL